MDDDWPWSSARAHLEGRDDGLVTVGTLLERESDWRAFLDQGLSQDEHQAPRPGERTGRPPESDDVVASLDRDLGPPWRAASLGSSRRRPFTIMGDKYCVPVSPRMISIS
jgi:putative transposase